MYSCDVKLWLLFPGNGVTMNTQQLLDYLHSELDEILDVLARFEGYQTAYLTGFLEALEGVIKFLVDK